MNKLLVIIDSIGHSHCIANATSSDGKSGDEGGRTLPRSLHLSIPLPAGVSPDSLDPLNDSPIVPIFILIYNIFCGDNSQHWGPFGVYNT